MPRLFIENFATGAYLRVLQEGNIETGNKVELIKEGKFKISVQSLFRAYFDKNYQASKSVMETAILIPQLSSEWSKKLSVRLSSLN
jgi:MOSC domain-containing protein YiiM